MRLYEVKICGACGDTFLWYTASCAKGLYCSRKCSATGTRKRKAGILTRNSELIAQRYVSGETLQEIGDSYGVSRERIRQVITKTHGRLRVAKRVARIESARKARTSTCLVCLRPIEPHVTERTLLSRRELETARRAHDGECSELYGKLGWYLSPMRRERILSLSRERRLRAGASLRRRRYSLGNQPKRGKLLIYWKRVQALREGK